MRLQVLLAVALAALQGSVCIAATTTDMPKCGVRDPLCLRLAPGLD